MGPRLPPDRGRSRAAGQIGFAPVPIASRPPIARVRIVAPALALAVAVVLGGCDVSEDADVDRGRDLFIANCGTCHKLAEAGTSANIGPDLDAAFAQSRADGMDSDTVEGVVEKQIAHPR